VDGVPGLSVCAEPRSVCKGKRSGVRPAGFGQWGSASGQWDSTPFDVVSVRSTINVYRIRDAFTGKEVNSCYSVLYYTSSAHKSDGQGKLTRKCQKRKGGAEKRRKVKMKQALEAFTCKKIDTLFGHQPPQVASESQNMHSASGMTGRQRGTVRTHTGLLKMLKLDKHLLITFGLFENMYNTLVSMFICRPFEEIIVVFILGSFNLFSVGNNGRICPVFFSER